MSTQPFSQIGQMNDWRLLQARSFLTFRQTVECGFTMKLVRDMIITYSQVHPTDKYSQHSSIVWPIWLNDWVFVYKLSGCGFESCCCHLINLYISYTLTIWLRNLNTGFTLNNCLFGSVKLTKNDDFDKYKYNVYGIGFDSRSEFSFTDGSMGKMSLFLELIWAHCCMLTKKMKIF